MSRIIYGSWEDPDWGLAWGRHLATVKAALSGRPGQTVLQQVEQALLTMPQKRLIEDKLCNDQGDICALGLLACARGWTKDDLKSITFKDAEDIAEWAKEYLGVSQTLAWVIQEANDELCSPPSTSPEMRYWNVLRWVQLWRNDSQRAYKEYQAAHSP